MFSRVQNMDKSIKAFMKKLYKEYIEIFDCLNSIIVQDFQIKRCVNNFRFVYQTHEVGPRQ